MPCECVLERKCSTFNNPNKKCHRPVRRQRRVCIPVPWSVRGVWSTVPSLDQRFLQRRHRLGWVSPTLSSFVTTASSRPLTIPSDNHPFLHRFNSRSSIREFGFTRRQLGITLNERILPVSEFVDDPSCRRQSMLIQRPARSSQL